MREIEYMRGVRACDLRDALRRVKHVYVIAEFGAPVLSTRGAVLRAMQMHGVASVDITRCDVNHAFIHRHAPAPGDPVESADPNGGCVTPPDAKEVAA